MTDLLVKNFPRIFDVAFTASLETELDRIEEGKQRISDILNDFYRPFQESSKRQRQNMKSIKGMDIPTDLSL